MGQGKFAKDLWEDASKFESYVRTTHLSSGFSENELVNQVTMDIYKNTEMTTIRIDIFAKKNAVNKIEMVECKYSRTDKNWFTQWTEAATDNQLIAFGWFKNNQATKVVIKATDAKKISDLATVNINILNGQAEIALNDISLYLYGSKAGKLEMKSVVIIKP
jgi:hypothetical protein